MPLEKLNQVLSVEIAKLRNSGTLKSDEVVVTGIKPGQGPKGVRIHLQGYGDKEFIRMNSNSYLGMGMRDEVIAEEEKAAKIFGAGPGAGRAISGTYELHVELERRLAGFHKREAGMIFNSAYSASMGTLAALITPDTVVISDELNHNCIINGIRLSRPKSKMVYSHNSMTELQTAIAKCVGDCKRIIIVTDGVFSMRGDYAPLPQLADLADKYDPEFEEGIITIVDDSHGVGAIGDTGRGTTEVTQEERVDILISTMGKALGVNGGYLVSDKIIIEFLKDKAPLYVYTNPITPSEASAILKALDILDSGTGRAMLRDLCELTEKFRNGLEQMGYEVIPGEHPIVPVMVRNAEKTQRLVHYLMERGVFATGIFYPIVPRGDDLIRFQVCSEHTSEDIDYVLGTMREFLQTD